MLAVWAFLKRIPEWVYLAVGALILGWAFVEAQKAEAVRRNNEKNERQRLEEQARVDQTRREITQENQDDIQAAKDAADSAPHYRATDELRRNDPAAARVVLGPDQGHGQ